HAATSPWSGASLGRLSRCGMHIRCLGGRRRQRLSDGLRPVPRRPDAKAHRGVPAVSGLRGRRSELPRAAGKLDDETRQKGLAMKPLENIRAITLILAFASASVLSGTAHAEEPCAAVDTDLTDARQQEYAELITH